ncbi:hypothetical protein ACJIZ3_004637 [Penstemon smallii]|uniref:WW domain-containing protein n=1 Tax=Penstemon smallii TaxID=265156 RepID=A0ABD3S2R4_9LAMI
MATPNMATITASLERSFKNFSLNHNHQESSGGGGAAHGSNSPENLSLDGSTTTTLELNSDVALPYHWEQCLDLKTGEIYYINWRTGMRAAEDPRTTAEYGGDDYSEDDISSYDSEGSSSESSPCYREEWSGNSNNKIQENCYYNNNNNKGVNEKEKKNNNVLVVAGCKSCFMYYMVPKQLPICPKCCGQLLLFDRSENGSL